MIYRIFVWETRKGDENLVGEMVSEFGDNSAPQSAFRYDLNYLASQESFPLDPISLPLREGSFVTKNPSMFAIFEDTLPDDWGRKLLVRKHDISRHNQNLANLLLAVGNSGLGALTFSDNKIADRSRKEVQLSHLSDIVSAAERFEHGEQVDSTLTLLFSAGSSPGGARPKAVLFDDNDARHYIAKFPSIKDTVDVVRIEAATMTLAKNAGLNVPYIRLTECGNKSVLLVQRFDIMPFGRRHMISFQTLLKASGFYQLRYQDLLSVLRKQSNAPKEDSEHFFRQMVFNGVIGNTDDHLKNFWMLFDHQQGWRLSPAFDLLPDVGKNYEHILRFNSSTYFPGRKKIEKIGVEWGIRNSENIVEEVFDAISQWKEVFAITGVSAQDIATFKSIDTNLANA